MKNISVVMSVYNEPLDWLKGSIESILNQTFAEFEFIIINDNPAAKELADVLKSYMNKDERITIIENPENLGLTKSLNIGIKQAKAKYIARMDADDISLPERLKLQYRFLENNSDVFLIGTSVQIFDPNGQTKDSVIKPQDHDRLVNNLLGGKLAFYHPTIMFRNENMFYREKFQTTQDYDLYLNILSKGKRFANLKDVLYYYRVSNKSISMNKRRKQIIYKKLAFKFYYERLQKAGDSYSHLDFNDDPALIKFLDIDPDKLEAEALRETIAFALGAGDYKAARRAFAAYKSRNPQKTEKFILRLFITFPLLHKLYRKLRYQILRA